jgi:hypothetical protein
LDGAEQPRGATADNDHIRVGGRELQGCPFRSAMREV